MCMLRCPLQLIRFTLGRAMVTFIGVYARLRDERATARAWAARERQRKSRPAIAAGS